MFKYAWRFQLHNPNLLKRLTVNVSDRYFFLKNVLKKQSVNSHTLHFLSNASRKVANIFIIYKVFVDTTLQMRKGCRWYLNTLILKMGSRVGRYYLSQLSQGNKIISRHCLVSK